MLASIRTAIPKRRTVARTEACPWRGATRLPARCGRTSGAGHGQRRTAAYFEPVLESRGTNVLPSPRQPASRPRPWPRRGRLHQRLPGRAARSRRDALRDRGRNLRDPSEVRQVGAEGARKRQRNLGTPCIYLVGSGGAFPPPERSISGPQVLQTGLLQSREHACSGIPQIAILLGSCTTAGAHVPCDAPSDRHDQSGNRRSVSPCRRGRERSLPAGRTSTPALRTGEPEVVRAWQR